MSTLEYKGYHAKVRYDKEDKIYVGEVTNVKDFIGFHAESMLEVEDMFQQSIDDYLATCRRLKRDP